VLAIAAIALAIGSSAVFAVEHPAARVGLVAFGVALCTWLARLPTR
jgi:hypothetical protein